MLCVCECVCVRVRVCMCVCLCKTLNIFQAIQRLISNVVLNQLLLLWYIQSSIILVFDCSLWVDNSDWHFLSWEREREREREKLKLELREREREREREHVFACACMHTFCFTWWCCLIVAASLEALTFVGTFSLLGFYRQNAQVRPEVFYAKSVRGKFVLLKWVHF